uniref:Uncharacterized protein n=1 Tax=Avena sativa TaxID=4498 RepID=A0ACD5TZ22_AVESA
MESTVLSLGKSVLDGALSYAKSALAEEVALQLRVRRDQFFITNELEMMQAFLMVAHDEGDNNDNKVVKVWVKQVRDVAYDVEDCLLDLAVRLERQSWWRIGRTLLDRRHVAKQMKELRANVEDVSQRNLRYNLIKGPKPTEQSAAITGATVIMSATDEARRQRDEANLILVRLITDNKDSCLKVISVWGKGSTGDLAHASIIKRAHEYIKIQNKFECQAFIGLVRPFSLTEFLQDVVQQFYTNSLQRADESEEKVNLRAQVLKMMGMAKGDDLALELKKYLTEKSYLIVLTDLNTMEEWERVKTCFPDNKKGSQIIVSTEQVGVASLCVGADNGTPEHKQLFADQTLHVFYKKGSHDGPYSTEASRSTSKPDNTSGIYSSSSKMFDRTQTMLTAIRESELIGREKEKTDIIKLITNEDERQECEVISLWGMGGLGKTTLVRDVYQSQELSGKFEKRACATIMHPFNQNELLRNLATQLGCDQADLIKHLEGKKYLIVLDDLLSNTEWDTIIPYIPANRTSSRIVVTTRLKDIAKHVSKKLENVYELRVLEHKNARDLFVEKVFKNHTNLDEKYPELVEPANLILKKCNGLPLAIVTIGGFLSNQPKTPLEWRKLNEHISVELEMNPELETIRTILMKSYDGLPYHLKACFLYLSIFPEDYELGIKRLLRRWIAEGYSSVVRNQSALEMANTYLMELIGRSMLLSFYGGKKIVSCQVHDLIREICISKSMEENLVLRLDESCSSLNTKQRTSRHLSINGNWQGDKIKFESMVDMARVRSVTMFGKWRPYFISDKMRMLRVLDLEDTTGLVDHHLEHVWKLLHLRYLSLKGCRDIYHLPDSLGNLAQLETLDIRSTSIVMLPKAITKLGKLQYLHAGAKREHAVGWRYTLDRSCPLLTIGPQLCAACCVPQLLDIDGFNRRDVCTFACCAVIPCIIKKLNHGGVMLARGSRKLKALQTLRDVDLVSGDNSILHDIKRLTGLRKLGLMSITKENGPEVFSVVSHLSHLQTLMVKSYPGFLYLGDTCSPPKDLHSLKLRGTMEKLPGWIKELHNLVKLELSLQLSCQSEHDAAIQVLGNLPNLSFLCLQASPSAGKELHFRSETFGSLGVLKLGSLLGTESVRFEQGAMPKLEQLKYWGTRRDETVFSGLEFLSSIKTVVVDLEFRADSDQRHGVVERVKKQIQEQLALNTNADKIILKLDVKVNTL